MASVLLDEKAQLSIKKECSDMSLTRKKLMELKEKRNKDAKQSEKKRERRKQEKKKKSDSGSKPKKRKLELDEGGIKSDKELTDSVPELKKRKLEWDEDEIGPDKAKIADLVLKSSIVKEPELEEGEIKSDDDDMKIMVTPKQKKRISLEPHQEICSNAPQEITKHGETVLSETKWGVSKIYYEPLLLKKKRATEYMEELHRSIKWQSREVTVAGRTFYQPRLIAWFGPLPYTYSNCTFEANEDWPPVVLKIRQKIEAYFRNKMQREDVSFNSVLLNLYRNQKDSIGWHCDDEMSMGVKPLIASISLGAVRRFEIKRKCRRGTYFSPGASPSPTSKYQKSPYRWMQSPSFNASPKQNWQSDAEYFLNMTHGSLLVMDGAMQRDWMHRVPKEKESLEYRINLTFRYIYPVDSDDN